MRELGVGIMPAILGGLSVGLAYLMLRVRLAVKERPALWICAGFATTTLWWVAGIGGTHLMAQTSAVFFLLAALYLGLGDRWPALAGLLFALAVGSRLPVGLALPVFLYLYRGRSWIFIAGALPVASLVGLYDLARFGSPLDFGYARIPSGPGLVTDEPWYKDGIMSALYIPRGIQAALFSWPTIDIGQAPFVKPSLYADSLLLTAPFIGGAILARERRALVVASTGILVLTIDLMHGNPGFTQFGYRFILDSMPLWLVVLGMVMRDHVSPVFRVAVIVGALVTAYGLWTWAIGFATI